MLIYKQKNNKFLSGNYGGKAEIVLDKSKESKRLTKLTKE